MYKTNINWGIIGCGDVTEIKSGPAYQKTDRFKLMGVMRRQRDKAKAYALRHNVPSYYNQADALIHNDNIDAIYIATPPDSHKFYALKVAAANKICCIEKPMAPSYADCIAICDAFKDKTVPLFVAYYRRSLPRFLEIKKILSEARIGKIRHISWHLSKPVTEVDLAHTYNWRTDIKIACGGYFDDLASHGLDYFAFILGEFIDVKGISLNRRNLYDPCDTITACWTHSSGVTGCGSWHFSGDTQQDDVEILGSSGRLTFSIFDDKPLVIHDADGVHETYVAHPETIQQPHVIDMAHQIFNGKPHPSNGQTAAHTSWVMDKILGKI